MARRGLKEFDIQRFAGESGDSEEGYDIPDAPGGQSVEEAGGDEGQESAGGERSPEVEQLERQNQELRQRLERLQQTIMSPEYLEQLRASARVAQAPPAPKEEPEPEPDWENMSPKEIAQQVAKMVKKEIEPEIEQVSSSTSQIQLQQQIRATQEKYPDFWSYREPMIAIARSYESKGIQLHPEDVYLLAKAKFGSGRAQPQKTLTAKKNLRTPTARDQRRVKQGTEKPGLGEGSTKLGKLSGKEAAEEAYRRIFSEG